MSASDEPLTRLAAAKLGETSGEIAIGSQEENRVAAIQLVAQASRSVDIYSRHLDPALYDTREFLDAITRLAIRSRHSCVRILIQDSNPVVQHGHRLIDLSYRLSSRVHIRKPAEQFKDFNQALLIVDARGYVQRKHADRYEGIANFNAAGEAGPLLKHFNQVWEMSQPDPNLRRLDL
jgi:hypothetical protein